MESEKVVIASGAAAANKDKVVMVKGDPVKTSADPVGKGGSNPIVSVTKKVDVKKSWSDYSVMYMQSVLVWNIRSHFLNLVLIVFLVVSWGDVVVSYFNFFQLMGVAMVLFGVVSAVRSHRRRKRALKEKAASEKTKEIIEHSFWSPQDATAHDLLRPGDGLFRGLFRRVKLVPAEELREQLALVKQSLHRALYASRILRFSQPTQFSLNLSFFAIFIAIIASFFPGRILLHFVCQLLLFAPGLSRRRVPELLLVHIRKKLGRKITEFIMVSEYLNLEETNTARVIAFVDSAEKKEGPNKPLVVTKLKE